VSIKNLVNLAETWTRLNYLARILQVIQLTNDEGWDYETYALGWAMDDLKPVERVERSLTDEHTGIKQKSRNITFVPFILLDDPIQFTLNVFQPSHQPTGFGL
jgi:hypothetical protein